MHIKNQTYIRSDILAAQTINAGLRFIRRFVDNITLTQ